MARDRELPKQTDVELVSDQVVSIIEDTDGSIHISVLNEGTMRVVTKNGERTEAHPNAANIHQPLIEDFASAVLENRDPVITGEIGRAVAVIEEKINS